MSQALHPDSVIDTVGRGRESRIVEEVFLSPRIVDETAMSKYTSQLRSIIEDAEAAAKSLSASASDGRSLLTTLAPTTGRLRRALESAQRIVRIVEARAAEIDTASQKFASAQARVNDAQQALLTPLDAKLEDLRARTDALIEDAQSRTAIECQGVTSHCDATLATLKDRINAQLASARADHDALITSIANSQQQAAHSADATAVALAQRMTDSVEEATHRASAFDAHIEKTLQAAKSQADAIANAAAVRLAERIDPLRQRAETAAQRVETSLADINEQCERALTQLVERVNEQIEQLSKALEGSRADAADAESRLRAAAETCAAHLDDRARALRAEAEVITHDTATTIANTAEAAANAQRAAEGAMRSAVRVGRFVRSALARLRFATGAPRLFRPRSAAQPSETVRDLLQHLERASADSRIAINRLDSVRDQADQARGMLADSLLASAPLVDAVDEKRQALERALAVVQSLADDDAHGDSNRPPAVIAT